MNHQIEAFLADLDRSLESHAQGELLHLYHIGRSSLVWRYEYAVTTNDIDILMPRGVDQERLLKLALDLFGDGAAKARMHGLYLQGLLEDFPPTPLGYKKRAEEVSGPWQVLRVYWLEPNDFAVTKLRRFEPKDRQDIRLLCDAGLLDAIILEERLVSAFQWYHEKDGDEYRDAPFRHLALVKKYLSGEIAEL